MNIQKIVNIFSQGLAAHSKNQSMATLGNRSLYVGSSDIGKCSLQSFYNKTREYEYELEQLLIFERGHLVEEIFKNAMIGAGVEFEHQKTVIGQGDLSFCKTHIDFYLPSEDLIVEIKSTKSITSCVWNTWKQQVQFQMGLSGIKKSVVFAFDINLGKFEAQLIEFNQTSFNIAIKEAHKIMDAVRTGTIDLKNDENFATQSPLCTLCAHRKYCEFLTKGAQQIDEQTEKLIEDFHNKKSAIKFAKENQEATRQVIVEFMQAIGMNKLATRSGITIELKHRKGSRRLNTAKLKAFLGEEKYQEFCDEGEESVVLNSY